MRKFLITAASAVFVLGLATAPASAGWKEDCAAKLKELENRVEDMGDKPNVDKLKGWLRSAKQGIEQDKKKKCFKMAGKVDDLLQNMGQ